MLTIELWRDIDAARKCQFSQRRRITNQNSEKAQRAGTLIYIFGGRLIWD